MLYTKSTKKYSHCQSCQTCPFPEKKGFYTIEFVYTLFMVTGFVWIILLYLSMSLHWQQQAGNQLIALTVARDTVEGLWLGPNTGVRVVRSSHPSFNVNLQKDRFPMPRNMPRFGSKDIPIQTVTIEVLWTDDHAHWHAVKLETVG